MSYSTRTRRSAASTAQAAIRRSIPEPTSSSTPRRRALAKSVSYAEVPVGTDDPEPSEHSSDGEHRESDAIDVQAVEDEDAEGEDDVVMEDGNGQSVWTELVAWSCVLKPKFPSQRTTSRKMKRTISRSNLEPLVNKRLVLSGLGGAEVDQGEEVAVEGVRDQLDRAGLIQRTRIREKIEIQDQCRAVRSVSNPTEIASVRAGSQSGLTGQG